MFKVGDKVSTDREIGKIAKIFAPIDEPANSNYFPIGERTDNVYLVAFNNNGVIGASYLHESELKLYRRFDVEIIE